MVQGKYQIDALAISDEKEWCDRTSHHGKGGDDRGQDATKRGRRRRSLFLHGSFRSVGSAGSMLRGADIGKILP
jgi:hypothetical protein